MARSTTHSRRYRGSCEQSTHDLEQPERIADESVGRAEAGTVTVKIRIPSSELPGEPVGDGDDRRPAPGPMALIAAGLVAVSAMIVLVVSLVSGAEAPESSVPPPFEASERTPAVAVGAEAWTERSLPGEGEVIAMGTVADTPFAVVRGRPETVVWRLADGAWQLDGSPELESVEAAVVMDDRVLLVGALQGRPTVWEWIDGSARYLFQPTAGFIAGAWSVGGRLVVAVAPTAHDVEQTIRIGREDALWIETIDGEFVELDLINIESVLSVGGQTGQIAVGGRDADGRAAVGFVQGERVLANPVPGAQPLSAVTHVAGGTDSLVARVSVANRRRGTHDEVRSARRNWALVTDGPDLVGVEVIDDVVVGVTQDGAVVRYRLDGEELPAPPSPPWSYGFVVGLALLGNEPVAYGQGATGSPMFAGPSVDEAEIMMPVGRWERYHSEASDGFRLFHVGSLEWATRDGALFYRSWNAERWRPVESHGELAVYGTPRIMELEWGYVLIPASGGGLWSSPDGAAWERVDGSESVRIKDVATNGTVLVGITHYGALGGPTSDVTVLDDDGRIHRLSLPNHVAGLVWEEGVGFAGSIVPPGSGYVTSPDGIDWTRHDGPERFGWIVAFEGALYLGTGDPVIEGDPPVATPGGPGWLFSLGDTLAFQDGTGTMWIHAGDAWEDAGFGVLGGLPERPNTVIVRSPRVFALVEGIDGAAETYVLELD
ncbi:MAG: hypothetical protein OEQ47_11195 [Acidimicrobiia bacterium]|nr:hypothetical protein [Acidimicrobiia bacterium]